MTEVYPLSRIMMEASAQKLDDLYGQGNLQETYYAVRVTLHTSEMSSLVWDWSHYHLISENLLPFLITIILSEGSKVLTLSIVNLVVINIWMVSF